MLQLDTGELVAELSGSRVGIVGFPAALSNEISLLLEGAGCVSNHLSNAWESSSKKLETYDVLLLCPTEAPPLWVAELIATPQPLLVIGSDEGIRRNSTLYLSADDVVFQPYSPYELLYRIYRVLRRRDVGALQIRPQRNSRVLIADDDPNILTLLKSVLAGHGLECYFATNGREALEMVRDLLPDVLVLDIEMPLMNGLEVLRAIRHDPSINNIKVLLLSASRDLEDIATGSSRGADGYIGKPFNHLLLVSRIKHFIAESNPSDHVSQKLAAAELPLCSPPVAEDEVGHRSPGAAMKPKAAVAEVKGLVQTRVDYLNRQTMGLISLREAVARGDFDQIHTTAHNIKSTGAAYGFPKIAEYGQGLESGAKMRDSKGLSATIADFAYYLSMAKIP